MDKKCLKISGIIAIAFLSIGVATYAGTQAQDVIKLETKAYSNHTKGIVNFEHRKHQEDFKVECGECHHDQNNKPLKNLKAGDDVQKCIECHKKPEYIKGNKAKGLSEKQKLEYHANAIHSNCKDCHRKSNKKTGKKTAPVTCKKCHGK